MDEVLKIIGIVGAVWLLLSILLAVAWVSGGRRIFRRMPLPPSTTITVNGQPVDATADAVVTEIRRRNRVNGRGL